MVTFDVIRDLALDAGPADAGEAAVRGRQAKGVSLPMLDTPAGTSSAKALGLERERRSAPPSQPKEQPIDAHPSATAHEPERDRQTNADAITKPDPSADQKSASSTRRGRRASKATSPMYVLPGGNQSDPLAQAGRVGDDGGAREPCDARLKDSPTVVETSGPSVSPEASGGDSSARCSAAPHEVLSPVVVDSSGPSVQPEDAGGGEGAQPGGGSHISTSPLTAEIVQLWRMRQRWHRAEKSLILQGKAICRAWTGGDKVEADRLFTAAAKGEAADPTVEMALLPFLAAIDRFGKERAGIEKRLRKLAQASPLWPWVSEVKGFGPLNLAAVIGEAGEIATYRNPSCLWKRMGLAVIDGSRQRRVSDADAALVHGYAPARRAVAYLIGDTLIKAGDACRYRPVYAARREHTATTHPDWTKAHSHNDAARYMVKRVLRDLWSAARST